MEFDVIGDITGTQTIVAASSIRERGRSRRSTSSLDVLIGAGAGVPGGIIHFGFRLVRAEDVDAAIAAVESARGTVAPCGEFGPGLPYASFVIRTAMKLRYGLTESQRASNNRVAWSRLH